MKLLADPSVPEEALTPYLTARRDLHVGGAPVLLPNANVEVDKGTARSRGDIGLGFLNSIYQARRRRKFEQRLAAGDGRPVLLAEGDSWFQYPVWLDDVIDHLEPDYNVFCLSAGGDLLRTMVAEAEYRDHLLRLQEKENVVFRAMLFSAGGNDVVGDQLRAFLKPFDRTLDAAGHVDSKAFSDKMARIVADFETMINSVRSVLPLLPILIHGYDYSSPLPEQGFTIPPKDGWVGEPMRALGIPDGPLQAEIVRVMIDGVNNALMTLAGGNVTGGRHKRVFFVDNRNVVKGRWADELHPTNEGFSAVADNFRRVMRMDAGIP